MKCIDSRPQPDGTRLRKYRTGAGRTVDTIEVPLSVWRGSLNVLRFDVRMRGYLKAERSRERQALALAAVTAGVKPLAVADELGMSTREVQRIRKVKIK